MVVDPDKCHYMRLGKNTVHYELKLCDEEFETSTLETVLEIEIDHILKTTLKHYTQLAITCSKLTTETLEQGVEYVQS